MMNPSNKRCAPHMAHAAPGQAPSARAVPASFSLRNEIWSEPFVPQERKMHRLAFSAFLLFAAAPAGAQIAGKHDYGPVPTTMPFLPDSRLPGPGLGKELRDIDKRIDRARDSGALSGREARQLEREARAIGRLAQAYGRDGLSPSERAELEARAAYLRGAVKGPAQARPRRSGGR
jgi:hypothetical protein